MDLEGSGHGHFEVLSWQFPGGTEETFKTLSQDRCFPAEIRNEHLKNMTSEIFHYASPLGGAELMHREHRT